MQCSCTAHTLGALPAQLSSFVPLPFLIPQAEHGLSIYAILCSLSAVVIVFTLLSFTLAGMRAARVFHEGILGCLMRAPMVGREGERCSYLTREMKKEEKGVFPTIDFYLSRASIPFCLSPSPSLSTDAQAFFDTTPLGRILNRFSKDTCA